ncbi:tail fiber protein [Anoxybacillus gonensis]|uniref:Tail fiber protein n=1 Tax=Anoxybacillus gonensis TaxID=198467 RepID=A0AAW7TGF7_9BACL|nr:tail fiber protein [Anoxybacillus gonensis]MDO0876766.1 tail fiber protein [Anoxybacillus gonensis]
MSAFGGLIMTNRGRILQTKAQTGVQLTFTRIALGDGSLSGQSILELNQLINEKKSVSITKLKTQPDGKAVVGAVLSNQDITTGFYWREIGVFAQDPDIGEILYCYGNAGSAAEYIPAGGGSDIIEKNIDIITIVGNASNVSATINQSLVFETPEGAQEKVDAHANDTTKHITEAERIAWNSKADQNHTHAFSDITGKPTTLAGYGITDAVSSSDVVSTPTANKILKLDANAKLPASITGNADGNAATASKLQTARTISLSGDATGSTSFDGSANAAISVTLANSGVTSGTYTKVTVDSKGRVTAGQSLSASDIPNLDWSKITSGKPTTLAGYGITDAIPASQKGAANGVASLDSGAKVPTSQLPSASTSAAGIVQLNNTTNSTSTTQAATANAVKQAYDKATQAETNAKSYTDQQLAAHLADNVKHITAEERAVWNSAEANAKAYTDSAPEAMQRNLERFSKYKSGKDSNGIYTTVEYKRADGTLFARSVLSGGTSPQYTTRTITYYDTDGTTVIDTVTYNLIYDTDGNLKDEVLA